MTPLLQFSLFVIISSCTAILCRGQGKVIWEFKADNSAGNEIVLNITGSIAPGWHLYSQFLEDGGPIPTHFIFNNSNEYQLIGNVSESGRSQKFFDKTFEMDIVWYTGLVSFSQKILLNKLPTSIKGHIEYMTCNSIVCIPDKRDFNFSIQSPK